MAKPVGPVWVSIKREDDTWARVGKIVEPYVCTTVARVPMFAYTHTSSVVGGSLDGAVIPPGTRDGQLLQWDEMRQRWVGK